MGRTLRPADQEVALDLLDRMLGIFGDRIFPIQGTLLGTVRSKGFVPGDRDVDLAVLSEDWDEATDLAAIKDAHFKLGTTLRWRKDWMLELLEGDPRGELTITQLKDRDHHIDFHVFWPGKSADPHHYFPRYDEKAIAKFPTKFLRPREPGEFCGRTVQIPTRAVKHVEWMYGPTWRTPIPSKKWYGSKMRRTVKRSREIREA